MTSVSIVIPIYNEAEAAQEAVNAARRLLRGRGDEVILVYGSPAAGSQEDLRGESFVKLHSLPGRGRQMNTGARAARGDILLFLHSDTRLQDNALDLVSQAVAAGCRCGAFRLKIEPSNAWLRFVAFTANIRNLVTGTPYGDQAIFSTRELFWQLGGYRELPLMEDLDFTERAKSVCGRVWILNGYAVTSARRWQKEGMLRTTVMHQLLLTLRRAGCAPEAIQRFRQQPGAAAFLSTLLRRNAL